MKKHLIIPSFLILLLTACAENTSDDIKRIEAIKKTKELEKLADEAQDISNEIQTELKLQSIWLNANDDLGFQDSIDASVNRVNALEKRMTEIQNLTE